MSRRKHPEAMGLTPMRRCVRCNTKFVSFPLERRSQRVCPDCRERRDTRRQRTLDVVAFIEATGRYA